MKEFFSKIWKWIVANKVISAVIGGVVVVGVTLAIVLPLSLRKRDDGQVDPPHVHTNDSAWSMDYNQHWHASTCGHNEEITGLGAHAEATEVIGQVDKEYRVYKVTCECGMVIYKFCDLNSSNVEVGDPYIAKIKELTMPTVQNEGRIVYYPNTASKTETLVVPKIGGNRRVTWYGEVRYDRGYMCFEDKGKYYASVNVEAYNYDGDSQNFILASMLYVDPAWTFEINHDVYLASRYVQANGFVKQKPTLTEPGIFRFRYMDMSDEDFSIPALNSTDNWNKVHVNKSNYVDEKDVYTFKEDAAYLGEITDEYLRWEYCFVMLDYDNVTYEVVDSGQVANYTALWTECDDNGAYYHTDDKMYFAVSVKYGSLAVGDSLYFETDLTDGLPTTVGDYSSVKVGTVEEIYYDVDDISSAVNGGTLEDITAPKIYADGEQYVIAITYAGSGSADEALFHDEDFFYCFSGTSAAHLHDVYTENDQD